MSFRFGGSPAAGPAGGGPSAQVSISADGRYVAFTSNAPDLVSGDTNGALDVFVLDRTTRKITRLGLPGGVPVPPGGSAQEPSISADGRIVAYTYQAPAGFTTVPAGSVVLAWDRKTGVVDYVSRNTAGTVVGGSRQPSVSANGRFVAFVSDNGSVAGKDGNAKPDVFRYDRTAKQTVLISARSDGISTPSGTSYDPSISADGNLVAFVSDAGEHDPPRRDRARQPGLRPGRGGRGDDASERSTRGRFGRAGRRPVIGAGDLGGRPVCRIRVVGIQSRAGR